MKHLASIIQYEFLTSIEEFPLDKDLIFMGYCSREDKPYFAKMCYNKNRGFNFFSRTYEEVAFFVHDSLFLKEHLFEYYSKLQNEVPELWNIRFSSIEDLKQDKIYSWCSMKTYLNYKLSIIY